jgi:DNA-binding beta-propeller fold protein YncE
MSCKGIRQGFRLAALALAPSLIALAAHAEIAVSANDNKVVLVNGVSTVVRDAPPDTLTVIDLKASPPKVIAEINVPTSVVGPPSSVAITPDESLALVASSMKLDPSDPTKTVIDNRVSVVDLKANPPAIIATITDGRSPSGIAINRAGNLALVANRAEGTVSVLTIAGKTVTLVGKVQVGDEKSTPSGVAISPDGRTALVTRDGDHRVAVLSIEGTKVEYTKRDLGAGIRPNSIEISPRGDVAVGVNIGHRNGDADSVYVVDLKAKPARIAQFISVGQTPESVRFSPDGSVVAVVLMNGSDKAKESPFYANGGRLQLFKVDGTNLVKAAEAPIGHWPQGVAFSADGRTVLVQNMVEKETNVLHWDGANLKDTGQRIKTNGGPAGIRTAEKPRQ